VVNSARPPAVLVRESPGFGDRRKSMLADIAISPVGRPSTEDLGINLSNVKSENWAAPRR